MTLADKIVVLKDGEVMQVGAPMELFNMPANEFVAGFLGSPKMNFFEGHLTKIKDDTSQASFKGADFEASDIRLVSGQKKEGDKACLGVRPQHMRMDKKGPLKGKVTLIERLGTETIVELVSDDETLFRFASPDVPELANGDEVRFAFDAEKAHLF